METHWFYMEGDQRQGPMDLEPLVSALLTMPAPHLVPVWRNGMAEWRSAKYVPEISQRLPPAPLGEAISRLHRRLVLLVGSQFVMGFFLQAFTWPEGSPEADMLSLIFALVLIGTHVSLVVTSSRLARCLGAGVPGLWAAAMFIPCINVLVLLALTSKAQAW